MFSRMIINQIRSALIFLVLATFLFGLVYPGVVTLLLQNIFPQKARGSLIQSYEGVRGSYLIGQSFSEPRYFWGRLSATTPVYNAAASQGSNLCPANPVLIENVKKRVDTLRAMDPKNTSPIPIDLVTASASGLDPHISLAGAYFQIGRVARARGLKEEQLLEIVHNIQENRQWGIFGEPRVNVLKLNRILDEMDAKKIRPIS